MEQSDGIKRFIALDMGVPNCNLACPYCYVPRESKHHAVPSYSARLPITAKCYSKERMGGMCFIYLYAHGETLLSQDSVSVIENLLYAGHAVGVVTNLTLRARVDEMIALPASLKSRLVIFASLHYTELKRKGWLNDFFSHVLSLRESGISCVVRLCMSPDYLDLIDEIKEICLSKISQLPVVTHYRVESGIDPELENRLCEAAKSFDSASHTLQKNISDVKRTEYCHAGEWSYVINYVTGAVKSCLCEKVSQNVYENTDIPLRQSAVGTSCRAPWCLCGVHFLSWGIIPDFDCPTYAKIMSADNLSPELRRLCCKKLKQNNLSNL